MGNQEPTRKAHGNGGTKTGMNECPGCGASIGELHERGCDWEACPVCGDQLAFCEHSDDF